LTEERWATIDKWPNYAVSDHGRIKRLTSRNNAVAGKILAAFLVAGYLSVNLLHGGKRESVRVHRLVAEAFIDNPEGLPEVNHIDTDRANAHYSNLEWVSRSGNRYHAYKTGNLSAVGSKNGYSKLTEEAVLEIRSLGGSDKALAHKFGVSVATIKDVKSRRTWTHV
jgi:hypothetical protein